MSLPLEAIMQKYGRVGIAGGPRTGKTTLSGKITDRRVIGTDSYKDMPWEDIPHRMIADVADDQAYLIEGVMVGRALRKGLPLDALIYLDQPMVEQKKGQVSMGKGVHTILSDWASKATDHPPVFIRNGDSFDEVPASAIFQKS